MDPNRYRKPVKQTLKIKKYRGVRSYRKKSGALDQETYLIVGGHERSLIFLVKGWLNPLLSLVYSFIVTP